MATAATAACRAVAGALLALLSLAASAGPDEDYQAALAAFRGGDMTAAMQTLRRTSGQGHAPSMVLLGYILEQSSFDADAAQLYRRAADAGSIDAEVALAAMVAAGKGTPRDLSQAVHLYESAAAGGNAAAVVALAQAYIAKTLGLTTEKRDNARAIVVLKRAAELGYGPAAAELARAYTDGDYGLARDPAEAVRWQPKSAPPANAGTTKEMK